MCGWGEGGAYGVCFSVSGDIIEHTRITEKVKSVEHSMLSREATQSFEGPISILSLPLETK